MTLVRPIQMDYVAQEKTTMEPKHWNRVIKRKTSSVKPQKEPDNTFNLIYHPTKSISELAEKQLNPPPLLRDRWFNRLHLQRERVISFGIKLSVIFSKPVVWHMSCTCKWSKCVRILENIRNRLVYNLYERKKQIDILTAKFMIILSTKFWQHNSND